MSAWIVSRAHIDALVELTQRPYVSRELEWAGMLTDAEGAKRTVYEAADDLGRILWGENLRSVAHRYPGDTTGERPGPVGLDDDQIAEYRYRVPPRPLELGPAFAALNCWRYQACECPDFERTEAARLVDRITAALISRVPGYEGAPWGIDDSDIGRVPATV